jgi:hypothetical protein
MGTGGRCQGDHDQGEVVSAFDFVPVAKDKTRGKGPRTKKKMKALQARKEREAREEFAQPSEREERDDR